MVYLAGLWCSDRFRASRGKPFPGLVGRYGRRLFRHPRYLDLEPDHSLCYFLLSWVLGWNRSARSPYPTAVGIVLGYTLLELLVTVFLNIDSSLRSPFGLVIFLTLSSFAVLIGALLGKRG